MSGMSVPRLDPLEPTTSSIVSTSTSSSRSSPSSRSTLPSSTSSLPRSSVQLTPSLVLASSPSTSSSTTPSLGLFATRPLEPGTLLFSEPPLLTCSSWRDLRATLSCSTDETRTAFWSLANAFPDEAEAEKGIFDTNAFALDTHGGKYGLFRLTSRINHSCAPNVKTSFVASRGRMEVRVVRRVEEGEEVRSSYLPPGELVRPGKDERRERLEKGWGFECACEACQREGGEEEALRAELRTILDSLPRSFFRPLSQDPTLILRHVSRALDLLDLLSLSPLCTSLFLLPAFKTCVLSHDTRSARLWVRLALKVVGVVEGEGGEGWRRWESWRERPERALERGEGGKGWAKRDLWRETREAIGDRLEADEQSSGPGQGIVARLSRLFGAEQ
ncbi:hypothetical protein JCM10049v2_006563 [Rhodotorula toruloides]